MQLICHNLATANASSWRGKLHNEQAERTGGDGQGEAVGERTQSLARQAVRGDPAAWNLGAKQVW